MTDADLIDKLGGPSRVAALLKLDDKGAVQRVSNWKRRGIPARVLLDHGDVFDRSDYEPAAPDVRADAAHDAA